MIITTRVFSFMRTHKELKEFVKSLCADEADILMDLLPSIIKSKKSNQEIIRLKKNQSHVQIVNRILFVKTETKMVVKNTFVEIAISIFLIIIIP